MSFRVFATRTARAASRWTAPSQLTRRGYASSPAGKPGTVTGAEKTSDLPWLITSVAVSVVGGGYLLSQGGAKAETHGASAREAHGESPATNDDPGQKSLEDDAGEAKVNDAPQGGDDEKTEKDHSAAPPGQDVPPPPADNSSGSENTEDKKEKHEQYKDTIEKKDTKVATSSSDMPSKKTAGEHPREDPQKGEGEAKQKGGSKDD